MQRARPHAAFLLVAAVLSGWSCRTQAQVHRCTLPDGTALYTDRTCASLGANEQPPPRPTLGAGGVRLYRGGCARNLQDLVYEMTTAIDAGDVNRLAGVYHWVDVSSSAAASLMDRLDAVVRRPLVDIVPISAPAPEPAATDLKGTLYPQTTVRRPPVGLRVQQTLANSTTPSETVFGLRRHLGCWWLAL